MVNARGKNAPARRTGKKAGSGKKKRYFHRWVTRTDQGPPDYAYKMRDLLVRLWASPEELERFKKNPTQGFIDAKLLDEGAEIEVEVFVQPEGKFYLIIPPPEELREKDLLMLAHHLIRSCASC